MSMKDKLYKLLGIRIFDSEYYNNLTDDDMSTIFKDFLIAAFGSHSPFCIGILANGNNNDYRLMRFLMRIDDVNYLCDVDKKEVFTDEGDTNVRVMLFKPLAKISKESVKHIMEGCFQGFSFMKEEFAENLIPYKLSIFTGEAVGFNGRRASFVKVINENLDYQGSLLKSLLREYLIDNFDASSIEYFENTIYASYGHTHHDLHMLKKSDRMLKPFGLTPRNLKSSDYTLMLGDEFNL